MAKEKNPSSGKNGRFHITGQIQREQTECQPGELQLAAYVLDRVGTLLGAAAVDAKGNYDVAVRLTEPTAVELLIGPAGAQDAIRQSSAYRQHFAATDWKRDGEPFRIQCNVLLPLDVWRPWWPLRICISGHVRKLNQRDGQTESCPVPYVKVEIFDVDREFCWWPWLRRWWDVLVDRPLIRVPDLLRERPFPIPPLPGPDPAPDIIPGIIPGIVPEFGVGPALRGSLGAGQLTKMPRVSVPTARSHDMLSSPGLPTGAEIQSTVAGVQAAGFQRVGEARLLDEALAARLDRLTLTSLIPPWHIFPRCFYSTAEVCETVTDCNGFFNCCFTWWPFHFRRGRLRYDQRPDIIIKVTQVINGVPTVIYLDPYTSTRWNATHAHIDLFLDNEDVVCGTGDCGERPPGSPVFFTRIGDDEVYRINQTSGLYNAGALSNVAYGGQLQIYAQFGDDLSDGSPPRFYRLSYARQGSSEFTPLTAPLEDTRVAKATLSSESHNLGPVTINGVSALYEVRDFDGYHWYNPDWIGSWYTPVVEDDTGTYILRLEVFDENGVKLTTAMGVDYRDGTVAPPAVLPPMTDRCDVVLTLDNQPPELELTIPAVVNDCGVIPWASVPPLNFQVSVSQPNNRLHSWGLYYSKGIDPTTHYLGGGSSNTGLPGSVNPTVVGAALLTDLTSTCAFALKLYAYPHIRDGRNFIHYREEPRAIAIEKCPVCPPCPPCP